MWYFSSPQVVYGEGSLSHLGNLKGECAAIITDRTLARLGYAERVRAALPPAMRTGVFEDVESDPSLDTIRAGAEFLTDLAPDWIIALGGGSVLDAAKGMWVLYEKPGVDPASINPIEEYGLRAKAHFAAIPTTSGTGSEVTWAVVLTDPVEKRKLGLGSRENLPDIAILDPELVMQLPQRQTADTGLDALVHGVEGFTSTFHNDFTDGLCLNAVRLVFEYLPKAYLDGSDADARAHMQNAASIAGLGFGNSMAALAHGMGHALGGVFHTPHGRAVALFLPYTIEYSLNDPTVETRYGELARFLGLPHADELQSGLALAQAVRDLSVDVGQPLTLRELGISREDLEREMDSLVDGALNDTQTIMSARIPEVEDLQKLFLAAWSGERIEF